MSKIKRSSEHPSNRRSEESIWPRYMLPPFAIVMKVGPHSGMSLEQIFASKLDEETRLGKHYWGYSGTLCHPDRVLAFVDYVKSFHEVPHLLLVETTSGYNSPIGKISRFSTDRSSYGRPFLEKSSLKVLNLRLCARDSKGLTATSALMTLRLSAEKTDRKPTELPSSTSR